MTGDIGTIDREGYITIFDRSKEMIKYKGLQVLPSELEGILLEHLEILDAGVVGVWSKTWPLSCLLALSWPI